MDLFASLWALVVPFKLEGAAALSIVATIPVIVSRVRRHVRCCKTRMLRTILQHMGAYMNMMLVEVLPTHGRDPELIESTLIQMLQCMRSVLWIAAREGTVTSMDTRLSLSAIESEVDAVVDRVKHMEETFLRGEGLESSLVHASAVFRSVLERLFDS